MGEGKDDLFCQSRTNDPRFFFGDERSRQVDNGISHAFGSEHRVQRHFEPLARFEHLRAWRARTAREHNVPAYVIFHDATLREIALRNPDSLDALAGVSGVGARKLEIYGPDVVACVGQIRD